VPRVRRRALALGEFLQGRVVVRIAFGEDLDAVAATVTPIHAAKSSAGQPNHALRRESEMQLIELGHEARDESSVVRSSTASSQPPVFPAIARSAKQPEPPASMRCRRPCAARPWSRPMLAIVLLCLVAALMSNGFSGRIHGRAASRYQRELLG